MVIHINFIINSLASLLPANDASFFLESDMTKVIPRQYGWKQSRKHFSKQSHNCKAAQSAHNVGNREVLWHIPHDTCSQVPSNYNRSICSPHCSDRSGLFQANRSVFFSESEVSRNIWRISSWYNIALYIRQSTLRIFASLPTNSSSQCRWAALKSKFFCRSETALLRLRLRNRYSICFMLFSFNYTASKTRYIPYIKKVLKTTFL